MLVNEIYFGEETESHLACSKAAFSHFKCKTENKNLRLSSALCKDSLTLLLLMITVGMNLGSLHRGCLAALIWLLKCGFMISLSFLEIKVRFG